MEWRHVCGGASNASNERINDTEKVEGWLRILESPLLWRMLENARNTREEIAARILSSDGPESPTTPTNGST
jgi:hypothetical protein